MNTKELICPVPQDQRPINEYSTLKKSFGFSWTTGSESDFYNGSFKIYSLILTIFIIILNLNHYPWKLSCIYSIFWVSFILFFFYVRIYLGWNYIQSRLMKATVAYEESGWYDGQIWIKPAEILIQDKLIGEYKVKPLLERLNRLLMFFVFSILVSLYFIL